MLERPAAQIAIERAPRAARSIGRPAVVPELWTTADGSLELAMRALQRPGPVESRSAIAGAPRGNDRLFVVVALVLENLLDCFALGCSQLEVEDRQIRMHMKFGPSAG